MSIITNDVELGDKIFSTKGINEVKIVDRDIPETMPLDMYANFYVIRKPLLSKHTIYNGKVTNILFLQMEKDFLKKGDRKYITFPLIGATNYRAFMKEMRVNEVERLRGKEVKVYLSSDHKIKGLGYASGFV